MSREKGWTKWNVRLWVNNDEGLYRFARDCIKRTRCRKDAATMMLEGLGKSTPDGAVYSVTNLIYSMVEIDR